MESEFPQDEISAVFRSEIRIGFKVKVQIFTLRQI